MSYLTQEVVGLRNPIRQMASTVRKNGRLTLGRVPTFLVSSVVVVVTHDGGSRHVR